MSSVTHDLHQYRYVTSVRHPLPWAHVRHVCVPELRNESPDLPFMANLIAGVAACDISLAELREHNDTDILQLIEVLQACLQFTLWSQNILKEKMLELQSSQVAKRVSMRQLDHVESRCRALEKEVTSLTSERDTLSLGTASLRTSLVQLETTVKMQERQLKQERERTSLLLSKLEKALAEKTPSRALTVPAASPDLHGVLRCPTCGHRRSSSDSQHLAGVASDAKEGPARHNPESSSLTTSPDASPDTATSYTEDSFMSAEAEFVCSESRRRRSARRHRNGGGVDDAFPFPCLDWRTLVRYIIHEEKRTPVWPAATASPSPAAPTVESPSVTAVPLPSPPADSQLCLDVAALLADFTAAVVGDVGDFARATASESRDFVAATMRLRGRELAVAQHAFLRDVLAVLHTVPSPSLPPPTAAVTAAPPPPTKPVASPPAQAPSSGGDSSAHFTQSLMDYAAASSTRRSPSLLLRSVDAAGSANARVSARDSGFLPPPSSSSAPLDSTGGKKNASYDYGSLYGSRDASLFGSPAPHSQPPSLFTSPVRETRSRTGRPGQRPASAGPPHGSLANSRESLLPTFSPDILRTPHTSPDETDSPTSADAAPTADVPGVDNNVDDGQPPDADFRLPTSTSESLTDSYQTSSDRPARPGSDSGKTAATALPATARVSASAHSPLTAKPVSTPPVHPALSAQQSGSPLTASPSPGGFSLYRTVSLQSSIRSDASGGSAHASSQMLRDTQRELEALLAEDAAAERVKKQK